MNPKTIGNILIAILIALFIALILSACGSDTVSGFKGEGNCNPVDGLNCKEHLANPGGRIGNN